MAMELDKEDYKAYLKENHRAEYKRLKAEGTLDKVAQERVDRAEDQYNSLLDSMMKDKPESERRYYEMVAMEMTNEATFHYTPRTTRRRTRWMRRMRRTRTKLHHHRKR